ncbi:MAG: DUF11 domain-containing protein [Candidatus Accumulibacter sp.]|jgi:uncharacterized repeat protein (TIGR01451 family)|nr:DUF11 domain-containing protein [Accumulibacter sp.]
MAALSIGSVTVNGATVAAGASVAVAPGASVAVVVTATTTGGTAWKSTSWQLGSAAAVCVDHANHTTNGTYSESLTIPAPTAPGNYSLTLRAMSYNDACGVTSNAPAAVRLLTFAVPQAPALSKTVSTASASVDDYVMFTLTASNPQTGAFSNVVVTDVLPAGMSYVSRLEEPGTVFGVSGRTLTWTIPALAPGASASLTLVVKLTAGGWLTNTITSPGAVPASASLRVLASAATHFRMDESGSWSGAANSVLDSGGTALHGHRNPAGSTINAVSPSPTIPTIASQHASVIGGFCNAGKFDGSGVVQVASSTKFRYTNQLSASAWIYPTAYPASDYYSILSNDVNYEFHLSPTGKLYWWWSASNLTSATTIPKNQWTHVAITMDSSSSAKRQRIYINGVEDANKGSWSGTLTENKCPFYIGGDITTSSPPGASCALIDARKFRGYIDEVKLYDRELTQEEVQADMNLGRQCAQGFDHIRIEHDGEASVCAPETVTIKACLNESCSFAYYGRVQLTLTPSGWVDGDSFAFEGGIASRKLSRGAVGAVTLGVASVSPTAVRPARCFYRGVERSCTLNFAAANCSFDAVEPGGAPQGPIFTKLAGTPFNLDVLALNSSSSINTAYTGTISVDLVDGSGACPTGSGLTAAKPVTFTTASAGRQNVTFDYGGNAARNVRVRARIPNATTPACSSDSFTIRPAAIASVTSSANADASGTSANASPAVRAGAVFTLIADTGTPGYDGKPKADAALIEWAVSPTGGRPSPPGTGTLAGSPTPGDLGFATAAAAGTGNGAAGLFTYDEAGYFRFLPNGVYDDSFTEDSHDEQNGDCVAGSFSNTLAAGRYGCNFGNAQTSAHFGRFIPDHFDTALTQGCAPGGFTYSGQPFDLTVTARNSNGAAVQNYSQEFARNVTLTARNAADTADNPGPGALAPASLPNSLFTAGEARAAPAYAFGSAETPPAAIRVRASDGEISSKRDPASASVEGEATIRSGRAAMSNAYGSELVDLAIAFRAEYFDAAGWRTNDLDSCTGDESLGAANAVSLTLTPSPAGLPACVLDSGAPGRSGAGCSAAAQADKLYLEGPMAGFAGDFNLWLQAPGANRSGSVKIEAAMPPWLGNAAATAQFGQNKSPLIYRKENF